MIWGTLREKNAYSGFGGIMCMLCMEVDAAELAAGANTA